MENIFQILEDVDISSCIRTRIDKWTKYNDAEIKTTKKKSGVEHILKIIRGALKDISEEKIPDNFFFEYSILPSVLDTDSKDKLICFSYRKGDVVFAKRFENENRDTSDSLCPYEQAIAKRLDSPDAISIYHHPNFLFDIKPKENDLVNITYVTKPFNEKRGSEASIAHIKSMSLDRPYSELIEKSRKYYEQEDTNQFEKIPTIQQKIHNDIESITQQKVRRDVEESTQQEISTCFVSFPIVGSLASNQIGRYLEITKTDTKRTPLQGVGAFFLFFEIKDSKREDLEEIIKKNMQKCFKKIGDLIRLYSINYILNLGFQLQEEARKETIKSALAAVMARNLSHNIGSHVLVKAVNIINKKFFEGTPYENNIQCETIDIQCQKETGEEDSPNKTSLSKEISDLLDKMKDHSDHCPSHYETLKEISKHLAKNDECIQYIITLLNYIKTRMDYIADITTSTPAMENTKNFRKEIMDGFLKNRLLIDTISGTGDFKYKFEFYKDGKILDKDDDVQLSIPNDILGNHAFYVILENLIRNTAKHGKVEKDDIVTFEIWIDEANTLLGKSDDKKMDDNPDKFYAISVVINHNGNIKANKKIIISNFEKENPNNEGKTILESIKNDENVKDVHWIAFEQNEIINRSILDKNGQLRQGGWGILEMEASAAYLRALPKENIEDPDNDVKLFKEASFDNDTFYNNKKINILKAYVKDEKHLAYRFFVFKPKEILIVGKITDVDKWDVAKEKECLRAGIERIDKMKKGEVYPHRLVIDYTDDGKGLTDKACFSRQILIKPEIDWSKDEAIIKKNIWKVYEIIEKKRRATFLDVYNLNKSSDHGKGYDNEKLPYIEIKTSDNEQYTDTKKITKWIGQWKEKKWTISCNARVKVIDERIQDFALANSYSTKDGNKIPYRNIYKNTFIFIPGKENDLNNKNFDETSDSIEKYIQESNDDIDFLVIHLGIIEKLISSHKKKVYDKEDSGDIKEFIRNVLCGYDTTDTNPKIEYDKVIVISGRGKPHNLPDDIRFLNFSIIAQYLIDRRCKYTFAEAIYSARKFNNKP